MDDPLKLILPRPSFLTGAARVLDLGGTLTRLHLSPIPKQSASWALQSDWEAVGRDIQKGIAALAPDLQKEAVSAAAAKPARKARRAAKSAGR